MKGAMVENVLAVGEMGSSSILRGKSVARYPPFLGGRVAPRFSKAFIRSCKEEEGAIAVEDSETGEQQRGVKGEVDSDVTNGAAFLTPPSCPIIQISTP